MRQAHAAEPAAWESLQVTGEPLPAAWGHQTCARNGMLYILSRSEADGAENETQVHAVALGARGWRCHRLETPGEAPPGLDSVASVLCGSRWVLFGGSDGEHKSNSVYVLDLASSTWSQPRPQGDIPAPREGHAAVLLGERMFVFGGNAAQPSGDAYVNDVYCLDLNTFVWTRVGAPGGGGPAPAPRDSHAAVAWAGRLLVLGGDDARDEAAEFRKDVWAFDPARRAWSEIQVLNAAAFPARASMAAVATPYGVLVFGGADMEQRFYDDCWLLELGGAGSRPDLGPNQARWVPLQTVGQPPAPRFVHSATLYEGSVYVSGGTGAGDQVFADLHALRLRPGWQNAHSAAQAQRAPLPQPATPQNSHSPVLAGPAGGAQQAQQAQQDEVGQQELRARMPALPAVPRLPAGGLRPPTTPKPPVAPPQSPQQAAAGDAAAAATTSPGRPAAPQAPPVAASAAVPGALDAAQVAAAIPVSTGVPASALLAGVGGAFAPPPGGRGRGGGRGSGGGRGGGAAGKARQLTSYTMFQQEQRLRLKAQNPTMDNRAIDSVVSSMWGRLSEEDKEVFKRKADQHNAAVAQRVEPERKRRRTAGAATAAPAAATPSAATSASRDLEEVVEALLHMEVDQPPLTAPAGAAAAAPAARAGVAAGGMAGSGAWSLAVTGAAPGGVGGPGQKRAGRGPGQGQPSTQVEPQRAQAGATSQQQQQQQPRPPAQQQQRQQSAAAALGVALPPLFSPAATFAAVAMAAAALQGHQARLLASGAHAPNADQSQPLAAKQQQRQQQVGAAAGGVLSPAAGQGAGPLPQLQQWLQEQLKHLLPPQQAQQQEGPRQQPLASPQAAAAPAAGPAATATAPPGQPQAAEAGGGSAGPAAPAGTGQILNLGVYTVNPGLVGSPVTGVVDGVFGTGTTGGYTALVELNGVQYRAILTSPFLALQPAAPRRTPAPPPPPQLVQPQPAPSGGSSGSGA